MTPHARAILDAARRDVSPSSAQVERLRARLSGAPITPVDPGAGSERAASGAAKSGAANWGLYVMMAIAITAVVLGAVVVGAPSPDSEADSRRESPPASAAADPRPIAIGEPEPDAAVSAAPGSPEHEDATSTVVPPVDPSPASELRPVRRSTKATAPSLEREPAEDATDDDPAEHGADEANDFAAELALLVRARKALARDDHAEVRSLVARHAREFPTGAFVEEARVLDLLARCATDDGASPREAASAYVARPNAMFADRVRRACLHDGR